MASSQITEDRQTLIINTVIDELKKGYIFEDIAQKMAEFVTQKLERGEYKSLNRLDEFTEQLTTDLYLISNDKHIWVMAMPPGADKNKGSALPQDLAALNYGFQNLEILYGNIGYLKLNLFAHAKDAGAKAVAAMNFLAHTDGIIFDLRDNGGGEPSMVQLIGSYLFDESVQWGKFYIRRDNSTQQSWTYSYVEGPRLSKIPVYILTSSYTFSGAEDFAYTLKHLKRATIVGEKTAGGAHFSELKHFESLGVTLKLPYGRGINPITGTNWEGVGVVPDIPVSADQALFVAHIEIMNQLLENEEDEKKKAILAWKLEYIKATARLVSLDESELKIYVGTYGHRIITFIDDALWYQEKNGPRKKMIPFGDDLFGLNEVFDIIRLKFIRDAGGKVAALQGLFPDGSQDQYDKNLI